MCPTWSPAYADAGAGKGFCYRQPDGMPLNDPETLKRIKSLAVPPAWTGVWICRDALGRLQAAGRDARGRKQYRYHPAFREIRESAKYDRLVPFAQALPRIRASVSKHMGLSALP
jgi:DNA topoisomerase I